MLFTSLLALVPLLGGAAATALPRQSAPFGRLHPYDKGTTLCVAPAAATVGSVVGLVTCNPSTETASELELFNITSSAIFNKQRIALQAYPDLCLDGGFASVGGQITLQPCGGNSRGQLLSYSTVGYLSFQDANCVHKKSDSKIDIQSCFLMNQEIVFYPS